MKVYAGFYNGMERDLANHNQGLEQSVLENLLYRGLNSFRMLQKVPLNSMGYPNIQRSDFSLHSLLEKNE